MLGKTTKKTFDYPGQIVHSDVCGPLARSKDDRKYFVTFMDQHPRFVHVMVMEGKSDVARCFKLYKECSQVRSYFKNGVVQRLHSDGGGEYKPVKDSKHFEISKTTPDTPQHIPFAALERSDLDSRCESHDQCVVSHAFSDSEDRTDSEEQESPEISDNPKDMDSEYSEESDQEKCDKPEKESTEDK